jgi:hypothetical protein
MSDKRVLIEKMLEMQKQFIEYEQTHGVEPEEYWASQEGHRLHQYREKYMEMAREVIDLAHEEKGSRR